MEVDDKTERLCAAAADSVVFISTRVVSLVMNHARALTLRARGGGRVHVQWEALGNHLSLSFLQV